MSKFGSSPILLLFAALLGLSMAATYRPQHIQDKTLLLFPMPENIQSGDSNLPLVDICNLKFSLNKETGAVATAAKVVMEEYRQIIFGRGLASCPPPTTQPAGGNNQGNAGGASFTKALTLSIAIKELTNVSSPVLTDEEMYTLTLKQGELSLEAERYSGFIRGLETFSQLVSFDLNENGVPQYYIPFTPLRITADKPAFPYRGVMVDTTANFLPVSALKNVINLMMYSKMNVLHLYLSHENRSTYFHSDFTKSKQPADSFGYTDADIAELKKYAQERAVHLLPEINVPFHVKSIATSDKLPVDLTITCEEKDKSKRTFLSPFLNPNTKDATTEDPNTKNIYPYALDVMQHMTKLTDKEFMHMGGLEFISTSCYAGNTVAKLLLEPSKKASFTYMTAITKKLDAADFAKKVPKLMWINSRNETLKTQYEDVIYQFYGTSGETPDFVNRANSKVIISPIDLLWSTCGYSSNIHPAIDCKYRSWWNYYNLDFNVYFGDKISNVLGAEVTAFGDMVSKDTLNLLLFPRTTALSERLWNKARGKNIHKRLLAWIDRVRSRGYRIPPITNNFCENNVETCFGVLD